MSYNKPEIAVLGSAADVICSLKMNSGAVDGIWATVNPAYELDEE